MKYEKLIVGLIAGFVVTGLSIFWLESLGKTFFEEYKNAPLEQDMIDQFVMCLPTGAFIALLLAHVIGVFLGTITASYISKWDRYVPAVVIGVVLASFSIIHAIEIQHPLWYSILDTTLVIPTALLAHRVYLTKVTDPLKV